MKIVILGSTGILGKTLKLYLIKKKITTKTISREKNTKSNINLKNFSDFKKLKKLITKNNPTHVINCVGITKFNKNYKNNKLTYLLNTKMPIYIARLCKTNKIYFIHVSTDCVFSGKKGNYADISLKDSRDLYGISKSKGEVKNSFTTTIRTSFIGPELNTTNSLLNWFLAQNKSVNGYNNAFFSGITSLELSKIIYNYSIKKNLLINKIINVGSSRISKYELLCKIKKIFKKKNKIIRDPRFKIDRSLNIKKFIKLTKYKIVKWDKMLIELKKFMAINQYKF